MSDFERHAQRKNRVIQANYDDELLKIGIDCKVSSKFLTSDARRFHHRVSSSQKSLPGAYAKQTGHTGYPTEVGLKDAKRGTKLPAVKRKGGPESRGYSKEAWVVRSEKSTGKNDTSGLVVSKTSADTSSEPRIFLTDTGLSTPANGTSRRIMPRSAKVPRKKPDEDDTSRRPKTTTFIRRRVTFWDMVEAQEENSSIKTGNGSDVQRFKASKKISHSESASSEPSKFSLKQLSGIPSKTAKSCIKNIKKDFVKPVDRESSVKPLTSFLHFDKLQASHELRRELRSNAESRKVERRRRRLSEMLNIERTSYMESLSKMASRLRDEKLLEFCRESCRGLHNVFNYNL